MKSIQYHNVKVKRKYERKKHSIHARTCALHIDIESLENAKRIHANVSQFL